MYTYNTDPCNSSAAPADMYTAYNGSIQTKKMLFRLLVNYFNWVWNYDF